jgi:integrase
LADVDGKSCRDYAKSRTGQPWRSAKPEKTGKSPRLVTAAGVRRELEDMRAAINYHHKEGLCTHLVSVTLPQRSQPKDVFLTRSEVASLLWTAWRRHEVQKERQTKKWTSKHIARFILIALYSGSRHDAICGASFQPAKDRGWVNLEKGVFNRLRQGRRQTNKRQPPVRLPRRLLAHLRRWHRLGISKHAVVEFQGVPIASVRKGFEAIVKKAGLEKRVTPHTLRHTAATWLMQEGKDLWTAAGFLGTSVQMLEQTYAKHHPDFQADVLDAFSSRGKKVGQ